MKALILVDLQNDFFPHGALAVNQGDEILPVINQLVHLPFDLIVATKDWHPLDHASFAVNQGKLPGDHVLVEGVDQILWPVHCVQNTQGADFVLGWDRTKTHQIIHKGTDRSIDSYSTFFDNGHRKETGLDSFLKKHHIKDVYVAGLATDYCVKFSVIDACNLGYTVYVVSEGCRGVNLQPDDSAHAFDDMRRSGAHVISIKDVLNSFREAEQPRRK